MEQGRQPTQTQGGVGKRKDVGGGLWLLRGERKKALIYELGGRGGYHKNVSF